jgi:hypothetical protein
MSVRLSPLILRSVLVTSRGADRDASTERDFDDGGVILTNHTGALSPYFVGVIVILVFFIIGRVAQCHEGGSIASRNAQGGSCRVSVALSLRFSLGGWGCRVNVLELTLVSISADSLAVQMAYSSRRGRS